MKLPRDLISYLGSHLPEEGCAYIIDLRERRSLKKYGYFHPTDHFITLNDILICFIFISYGKIKFNGNRETNRFLLQFLTGNFPEEAVADFYALYQRMIHENKSKWLIYGTLFYKILGLIWAFYIEIKIDNLRSPPINQKVDE